MAVLIEYFIECPHDCGGQASSGRTLDCTADENPRVLRIDISSATSQTTFTCDVCGHDFYTGDLEDSLSDDCDGECDYEDEDEDEDDAAVTS